MITSGTLYKAYPAGENPKAESIPVPDRVNISCSRTKFRKESKRESESAARVINVGVRKRITAGFPTLAVPSG